METSVNERARKNETTKEGGAWAWQVGEKETTTSDYTVGGKAKVSRHHISIDTIHGLASLSLSRDTNW